MNMTVTENLELSGKEGTFAVEVEWCESSRARRINLAVPRCGPVRLALPRGVGREEALCFLYKKQKWLQRMLARRLAESGVRVSCVGDYLARSPWVCIAGRVRSLECAETSHRPFLVHHEAEEVVLFRHRGGKHKEADLRALLRLLAAETLPAHVLTLARRTGMSVSQIGIRDQRSRWGSCACTGRLSLNWRLVLLPPALQEYIILHELAHRVEMNHSGSFWELLSKWDPESDSHDRALSREWSGLMDLAR